MHNEIVCNSVSEMSHFYPESFSEKSRSVHIEILKKISIKIKIWKFFYLKINKIFYLKSISPKKLILYAVRSCPDYVWNLSEIRAQIKWTPCILNSSNFLSVIFVIYCKICIEENCSYSTVEIEIREFSATNTFAWNAMYLTALAWFQHLTWPPVGNSARISDFLSILHSIGLNKRALNRWFITPCFVRELESEAHGPLN